MYDPTDTPQPASRYAGRFEVLTQRPIPLIAELGKERGTYFQVAHFSGQSARGCTGPTQIAAGESARNDVK